MLANLLSSCAGFSENTHRSAFIPTSNRGTNVQSMRTQAEWVGRGLYTAPARARSGDVATIEHVHTHTPPTQRSIAIDQQRSQPRPPAAAYRRHSTHVRTFPRALPLSSARLGPGLLRHPLQARLAPELSVFGELSGYSCHCTDGGPAEPYTHAQVYRRAYIFTHDVRAHVWNPKRTY